MRSPIKTAILATISETLLKPSAVKLEDCKTDPAMILAMDKTI